VLEDNAKVPTISMARTFPIPRSTAGMRYRDVLNSILQLEQLSRRVAWRVIGLCWSLGAPLKKERTYLAVDHVALVAVSP